MKLEKRESAAIFVDMDNLSRLCPGLVDHLDNWLPWLEDRRFGPNGVQRKFVFKGAYWNADGEKYRPRFQQAGFTCKLCRAKRAPKASSADFEITVDSVVTAFLRPDIKQFFFLSFDTDYLCAIRFLRDRMNKKTSALAHDCARMPVYAKEVSYLIRDHELRDAFGYTRAPAHGWFALWRKRIPVTDIAPLPPITDETPQTPTPAPVPSGAPDLDRCDIAEAMRRLIEAAWAIPGKPLTKKVVKQLLLGVGGFGTTSPGQYFGLESYEAMTSYLGTLDPRLVLKRFPSGMFALTSGVRAPDGDGGEEADTGVDNPTG